MKIGSLHSTPSGKRQCFPHSGLSLPVILLNAWWWGQASALCRDLVYNRKETAFSCLGHMCLLLAKPFDSHFLFGLIHQIHWIICWFISSRRKKNWGKKVFFHFIGQIFFILEEKKNQTNTPAYSLAEFASLKKYSWFLSWYNRIFITMEKKNFKW